MDRNIENLSRLRIVSQELEGIDFSSSGFSGVFASCTAESIEIINQLGHHVNELFIKADGVSKAVNCPLPSEYCGKTLQVDILYRTIGFYQDLDAFLLANKLSIRDNEYYIYEFDFLSQSENIPIEITTHSKLISLIGFLTKLSDFHKDTGQSKREMFFSNSSIGSNLIINYAKSELLELSALDKLEELNTLFFSNSNTLPQRRIFKNELINMLRNKESTLLSVIRNWNTLVTNFEKSFDLFLEDYSYEQAKSSTTRDFHELSQKFDDSIAKVSNYIFAIPIAYIFLLSRFNYKQSEIMGNSALTIVALLFFILVWFIPFKNISESLDSLKVELDDFLSKVGRFTSLEDVAKRLKQLRDTKLEKQRNKLKLAQAISGLLLVLVLSIYTSIHWDFILNNLQVLKDLFTD